MKGGERGRGEGGRKIKGEGEKKGRGREEEMKERGGERGREG